jgi:hypothetical protein
MDGRPYRLPENGATVLVEEFQIRPTAEKEIKHFVLPAACSPVKCAQARGCAADWREATRQTHLDQTPRPEEAGAGEGFKERVWNLIEPARLVPHLDTAWPVGLPEQWLKKGEVTRPQVLDHSAEVLLRATHAPPERRLTLK